MALSISQLTAWRDKLLEARLNGIREFEDQNGERVVYKSDSEMQRALDAAEREIARLSGQLTPKTLYFKSSKGVC